MRSESHVGAERVQLTAWLDMARRTRRMLEQEKETEITQYESIRQNDHTFIGMSPNIGDLNNRLLKLNEQIKDAEEKLLKMW
jgi:hypothetical protein